MNILKKLLIGLAVIILLLFIVSLFLPSSLKVTRSSTINSPLSVVFNQVNILKNWEHWSAWSKMPGMEITYGDQKAGASAYYSWTSPNGNGKLTIKESVPGKLIKNELDFGEMGMGYGTWNFEPDGEAVKVTWMFDTDIGSNPLKKLQGLMMDYFIGKSMDEGLGGVKSISESVKKIVETEVPGTDYALTHKSSCNMKDISKQLGASYATIMQVMNTDSAEMIAMPFCIYHKWDEGKGTVDLEAGIAINKKVEASGEVNSVSYEPTKAIAAHYYGDYVDLGVAHEAIDTYIEWNNRQVNGSPWEQYMTDPGSEADTSKWLTVIYYPIN